MAPSSIRALLLAGIGVLAAACGSADDDTAESNGAITSNTANAVQLKFKGELLGQRADVARMAIATQLQYVQGILLTHLNSNALTGMPILSNVRETVEGNRKRITYEAELSVAWSKYQEVPSSYDLVLPLDTTDLEAFDAKYIGSCGVGEYGAGALWHDFNPRASGCTLDDADVRRTRAVVTPHPQRTQAMYPEYDQIWSDGSLDVVAVFGTISGDGTSSEGATTRETFLSEVSKSLKNAERTEAPKLPGIMNDSTVSGTTRIGGVEKRVNVTGILVSDPSSAGEAFEQRYAAVSTKADLVIYEGHSGLGRHINTIARTTGTQAGKYQLVFFNGCQSLAYLESDMHQKRIALNGADHDPDGTKFLDVIANGRPAYGDDARTDLSIFRAMLDMSAPKTFNDLLGGISSSHLAVVFGEHDNSFRP